MTLIDAIRKACEETGLPADLIEKRVVANSPGLKQVIPDFEEGLRTEVIPGSERELIEALKPVMAQLARTGDNFIRRTAEMALTEISSRTASKN